jgi:hypothetical protein
MLPELDTRPLNHARITTHRNFKVTRSQQHNNTSAAGLAIKVPGISRYCFVEKLVFAKILKSFKLKGYRIKA